MLIRTIKTRLLLFIICGLVACTPEINQEAQINTSDQTLLTLVDFESESQMSWLSLNGADLEHVDKNDGQALLLKFDSGNNMPTLDIQPQVPWDLRDFDNYNLAFELVNSGARPIQFYLDIVNAKGSYQRRSLSVPSDFSGTVYIPLSGKEALTDVGMWGDVPPFDTNDTMMIWRSWKNSQDTFEQISRLSFFTIGNLENKAITLDNIRVRSNPPSKDDWMRGVVDKFGQNAKQNTALTIDSTQALQAIAKAELAELDAATGMPNRSKFGGYTAGPKLAATGFFRTEKIAGKWWMVDPQGYVFFSHGPANVRMANMSTLTGIDYNDPSIKIRHPDEIVPEDSMGSVNIPRDIKDKRYVISTLRNDMFEWLPSYDDPLANHYSYRRSTHKGPIPYGETYSFYQANLERRYGETTPNSFIEKWREVTNKRMHDWGFTSFGNWVDPGFYADKQVPYFANGWIIGDFKTLSGKKNHWGLMPDPYDPVFKERAHATISAVAKDVQASPWCIGIFIDNEKSWGLRQGSVPDRYGVILDALSKNAVESPAKLAFFNYLKTKYNTIDALNAAWKTNISAWGTIEAGIRFTQFSEEQVRDLSSMLEMLGEQYFKVVTSTLSQYLPEHLYMGARMANWGMPDEIIKASVKYSDVLSFNIYEDGMQEHYWKFLEEVDLPVVIGEFHIGTATDSGLFNPGIVHAYDQNNRAQKYKDYMRSVLSKPYMVGAHWFQYVDEPISGRAFDGENANIGFVTVTDIPYPAMVSAVKEITSTMYQQRLQNE